MSTTNDQNVTLVDDKISDGYLVTGRSGIYTQPTSLHGKVCIDRHDGGAWRQEWNSDKKPEHLHPVNVAEKRGICIPGFLIVPNELETKIGIRWTQPNAEPVNIYVYPALAPQVLEEISVSLIPPTPNTHDGHVYARARRHRSGTWDLVIEDNEVVYQRMSGDDLPREVFVPKYFRFHAQSKIEIERFKKGWQVRFLSCGSITRAAIKGNLPGDPKRGSIKNTSYYALYPPSADFEHEEYDADSEDEDEDGDEDGEVNVATRGRREKHRDRKTYPTWSPEVAKHNKDDWEEFLEGLKRIVEEGGGVFSMLETFSERLSSFSDTTAFSLHYMDSKNTDSTSNQVKEVDFQKYFVQKLPGLFIAVDPDNDGGQTSVVRHDKDDNNMYPVWDSTWKRSPDTLPMLKDQAFLTTDGPDTILAVPTKLEETITVHRGPIDGQQTTIYIHPSDSVDQRIPRYMRTLDAPDVSPEDLAKPIPPYAPKSSGGADVRQKNLGMTTESASEYDGDDDQDEGRPADEESEEEDDGDAAIASAPTIAASVGTNNSLYLHAFEHRTSYATLTLDERLRTLTINPIKARTNLKVINLRGAGGQTPITIQCYSFQEGRTLRFVDCGFKTMIDRKEVLYKECHVHLPSDKWHAGFEHGVLGGRERTAFGPHDARHAEYNAGVFARFMGALERIVGVGNVKKCKKVGDKIMDEDAAEDSDGDVE
ncbi:hypothetical protein J4E83_009843 [Alternaria metachromatica]|uniref:uncharacterized protein n=1 Tax=Alternaria metachromatica TaxID=283354 RepID=UPI0020C3CB11|nr:uncharacterized protein J4E83_009843 [Alternaria metachromatica]KAI4606932.1 hypothetical protein J4E83_009843 [Alternaria metachromatica]